MTQGIIVETAPREIRSLAQKALKEAWVKIIVCYIIVNAITSLLPGVFSKFLPELTYTYEFDYMGVKMPLQYSFFPLICSAILSGPFSYALSGIRLRLIRERIVNTENLFIGFKYFIKTLVAYILIALILALGTAPFLIAPMAIARVIVLSTGSAALQALASGINTLGIILAIVVCIVLMLLLSMTFNVMWDDPNKSVIGSIKGFISLMKKNINRLFILRLSYIGWAFLASFIYYMLSGMITGALGGTSEVTTLMRIVDFIVFIPMIAFTVYMDMGESFFYELATGHLVKSGAPMPSMSSNISA